MSVLFAVIHPLTGEASWYLARRDDDVEPVDAGDLEKVRASRTVLLVPGTDIHLSTITSAVRSAKDLRTAALFQLEDDVSQPVNELHLALGNVVEGTASERPVALASLKRMEDWADHLNDLPDAMASACEIIPETTLFDDEIEPFIYDGDGRVLVGGKDRVYAVDTGMANDVVPALLHQLEIREAYVFEGQAPVLGEALSQISVQGGKTEPLPYAECVATALLKGRGLDLRQGDFAPKRSMKINVGGWTASLALAGLALIVWIAGMGVEVLRLNQATDGLYDSMIDAYAASYPEEGRIIDPRSEVMQKLRDTGRSGGGEDFVQLISVFYTGLREVPGVELERFTFDQETGRLSATLYFSGYQDRDALKQAFDELGVPLNLGGARQEAGVVVGEAVLGGQP